MSDKTATLRKLSSELGLGITQTRVLARENLPPEFFVQVGSVQKLRLQYFDAAVDILMTRRAKIDAESENGDGLAQVYNYAEERARREHFEAENARLKYLERKRELLEAREVVQAYTDAARRTSRRMLQIPRQLAAEAVGLDAGKIEKLFETGIREALKELKTNVNSVELVDGG